MTIGQFIDNAVEERKKFLEEEGHTNIVMEYLRNDVIEDYIEALNSMLYSSLDITEE